MGMFRTKFLLYRQILVPNVDSIPLNWWAKHEHQFPTVGLFAIQIMGIVSSQIEIGRIFNMVGDYQRIEALSSSH
jgi:hypothetical protein